MTRALDNRNVCVAIAALPGLIASPRILGWITAGHATPDLQQACAAFVIACSGFSIGAIVWGHRRRRAMVAREAS
jgi:hypothetical protein